MTRGANSEEELPLYRVGSWVPPLIVHSSTAPPGGAFVNRVMTVSSPGTARSRSIEGPGSVVGSRAPLYPAQSWTVCKAPGNGGMLAGKSGAVTEPPQ